MRYRNLWRLRAFTLIELLMVILIIGILASLVMVAVQPIQRKSRDSQRKTDIQVMRTGMENFKSDFKIYPNYTFYIGKNGDDPGAVNSNFDIANDVVECNGLVGATNPSNFVNGSYSTADELNYSMLKQGFDAVNGFLVCLKYLDKVVQDPKLADSGSPQTGYQIRISYDYSTFIVSAKLENEHDQSVESLFGKNPNNMRYIEGNGKTTRQLADDSTIQSSWIPHYGNVNGGLDDGYYLYQCFQDLESNDLTQDQRSSSTYQPLVYDSTNGWHINSTSCGNAFDVSSYGSKTN